MRGAVLLHGRGGSGADMQGLAALLGLERASLAAPEAPGRSWWPTSFLAPMAAMQAPLDAALSAVEAAVQELGRPRGEIALVGFSQGGCLALEYAARRGAGLGGVVAFSAGLIGTSDAGEADPALNGHAGKVFDYATDLSGVPVLLTCHERDPHIPLKRVHDSAAVLEAMGGGVDLLVHPGPGHQPMPDGIAAARRLLT